MGHALRVSHLEEESYTDIDGVERLCSFVPVAGTAWTAVAGIPTDVAFAGVRARMVRDGAVLVLVVAGVTALALVLGRLIAQPMRRMADAVHEIAEGKREMRLEPNGPREIAEVAAQFNRMLDVREHAESALSDSQGRLQALFNSMREGVFLVDGHARHVDCNPAFCALLGRSREEILSMSLWDDVPRELHREVHALWEKFLATGRLEGEFVALRKDGTTVDVEYRAVARFMPDLHLCTVRDITERKRLERRVQDSEARYRGLVEQIPAIVYLARGERPAEMVYVSPQVERILGVPAGRLVGDPQSLSALIHPEDRERVRMELERAHAGVRPFACEYRMAAADGRTVWVRDEGNFICDATGRPLTLQGLMMDVTELKRAEDTLKEYAENLKSLSRRLLEVQEDERRALARQLHDRTGPTLTALNLHLRMIRDQTPPQAVGIRTRVDDAMALVESAVDAVRDVMGDLRPPVLEDYGLIAGLNWYGNAFAKRTGLAIEICGTEPTPRLPPLAETALYWIAQEACTNIARHAQASNVTITLENGSGHARLMIVDDGRGFRYEPGRRIGGWGLLTMQERAEAVGGTLEIDSAPERGTRVVVDIPRPH
jgi:two-component system sensor histidine kinase UhpB